MMDGDALKRACESTTAVILAGGKSQRIGRPKAFLELGNKPMIEWVLEPLRHLFPEVLIVSPDSAPFSHLGIPVVPDRYPDGGPLVGAITGIAAASGAQALVVGCDMPFLRPALLAHMADRLGAHAAVVPRAADGLHPLHAIYSKRALQALSVALGEGVLKLTDVLASLDRIEVGEAEMRRLDFDLHSLFNVNCPEDIERARKIIEARTRSRAVGPGENR